MENKIWNHVHYEKKCMAFSKEGPKWQKRGQKRTNFDLFSEKVLQRDQKTKRDQLVITGFYRWKNKFSSILNDGLLFEKMRDKCIIISC